MTIYFMDSSALLKRYIPEIGTRWMRSIVSPGSGHSIVVAQITPVEIVSGIMRRKRESTIPMSIAQSIRLLIDRHTQQQYTTIGLTGSIVQRAEDLLDSHPLRAYDSIQLASALESNQRLIQNGLPPLIFVSSDQRLLNVTSSEGLAIDDPNSHP